VENGNILKIKNNFFFGYNLTIPMQFKHSKLICIVISKIFESTRLNLGGKEKNISLGITISLCSFLIGKIHFKRLGHLGVEVNLITFEKP